MKIHDISLPVSEQLPVWPGDPRVAIDSLSHLERGDVCTVSRISFSAHSGTHVDAPAHFIKDGATVDSLALDTLIGPARVVDTGAAREITAPLLAGLPIPGDTERLLFRTLNSEIWNRPAPEFVEDFVAISADGARWLKEKGIRLVGIDYLSVAPFAHGVATHRILLQAGIVLLEGLNLAGITPGLYQLVCLPLKLVGGDGAPARAVLIEEE
ncbi:MAG: cyclase family protein [Desulfobacterales bacterium]|nr:cyclase family protein [Desulfobacterales bacterium]